MVPLSGVWALEYGALIFYFEHKKHGGFKYKKSQNYVSGIDVVTWRCTGAIEIVLLR